MPKYCLLQTPLKCGAPGGLKFHFICFRAKDCSTSDWFQPAIHSRIFLAAPTKFVPLSTKKDIKFPSPREKKAWQQQDMLLLPNTISTYTALVVKYVKKQHHLFIDFVINFTSNGLKKSTSVVANGKIHYSRLSLGRSAMKGWTPPVCCFLHLPQFNFTFLRAFWSPITQKFSCKYSEHVLFFH